jgi:hypothetical protein
MSVGLWVALCGSLALAGVAASAQIIQGGPVVADTTSTGGQSGSSVFIDTTKFAGSTPDAQIATCLANNAKCDASKESATTPLANKITISQSGVTLILGGLTLPTGSAVQLLSITGNNNTVYCAQGWNSVLDGHNYTANSIPIVSITGNGNKFSGCQILGAYLSIPAGTLPPLAKCITVSGNDNTVDGNFLQYCANTGIAASNANRARVQYNYVHQSFNAGISANSNTLTIPGSFGGEIFHNWVIDTELQFNTSTGNLGAGTGNINISSAGSTPIPGSLQGWLVHDNIVTNTNTLCNSQFPGGGAQAGDHGCSEGIQVTESPWDVHVYDNYVYNTGAEGITLCSSNCSATGNFVGDPGQIDGGVGGILAGINGTTITMNSNALIEGNTIWNDNSTQLVMYCIWENVNKLALGSVAITNHNIIGNTCAGTNGGKFSAGFKLSNGSTAPATLTVSGMNLTGNTIDFATVTNPIVETYTNITGKVYHGFNNIYGTLTTLPVAGDLAFFDPNSGTNGSYNLLDAGIAASSVTQNTTAGTAPSIPVWTGAHALGNSSLTDSGTTLAYGGGTFAINTAGSVTALGNVTTAGFGVPGITWNTIPPAGSSSITSTQMWGGSSSGPHAGRFTWYR